MREGTLLSSRSRRGELSVSEEEKARLGFVRVGGRGEPSDFFERKPV